MKVRRGRRSSCPPLQQQAQELFLLHFPFLSLFFSTRLLLLFSFPVVIPAEFFPFFLARTVVVRGTKDDDDNDDDDGAGV